MSSLLDLQDLLSKKVTKKELLEEQLAGFQQDRKDGFTNLEDLKEAQAIFQEAAKITQQHLSFHLEKIVTQAVSTVFNEPDDDAYEFKVNFVKRRNVLECDLLFHSDGLDLDPLDSCGFGAADIASLALRVAYWKLDEEARPSLILDEPLRNLSKDKQKLASFMIKELSKQLDLQFLVVSHNLELTEYADKVFRVTKHNKVSTIKEISA